MYFRSCATSPNNANSRQARATLSGLKNKEIDKYFYVFLRLVNNGALLHLRNVSAFRKKKVLNVPSSSQ